MKFRTEDIMNPPIVKIAEAARKYVASPDFLDLAQGIPGHIPPRVALDALGKRLLHPTAHRYTPDQGMIELREELALYLRRYARIDADPIDEIVITAGGNSAFAGTLLTILELGQNVIIPSPYYFNAVMAVKLSGGNVCISHVDENFQPDPEDIKSKIDANTKAVLLVTPNNPTGAVYKPKIVDQILNICLEKDLVLISDETYLRQVYEGAKHYSPRSRRDAIINVITIGSFSKDFGMSGWRVGYLVGPQNFVKEYLKVQDTITICAPTAGQMLALEILKNSAEEVDREMERLRNLRELAYLRMSQIDSLDVTRTKGTYYLFPRVESSMDSRALVLDILQTTKTLLLPGSIFGTAGEEHLRFSIGPLTPEAVEESFDRLERYFQAT
jgi:aspartate/methionine/tyrosine aminotransferase